jgi:hypothetical protein
MTENHQINKSVKANWPEQNLLHNRLFSLGDIIPINFKTNPEPINDALKEFKDKWQTYNPRDKENARYGIPITSHNGDIIDPISLDSLRQYNKENGVHYTEGDFILYTPIVQKIPKLVNLLNMFDGNVHRSHFLRLSKGGHFPPHRDSVYNTSFRVLVPLTYDRYKSYFTFEEQPYHFENGQAYVINTVKRHTVFSMKNHMDMIVLNIALNNNTVDTVFSNLDGV